MSDNEARPGCHLCPDEIPRNLVDLLDHLRVLHPDAYGDGPERWPDGAVVLEVEDDALTPEMFTHDHEESP